MIDPDTTVPHVSADPVAIMRALMQTPPPSAGDKSTRKALPNRKLGPKK
jgi:hypothetical protein